MSRRPGWALIEVAVVLLGCREAGTRNQTGAPPPLVVTTATPPEYHAGEGLFDANCATCHGPRGSGSSQGPPLVHIIYEPNHHADVAFLRAVQFGTRAHHWRFGDMPPVSGVGDRDVQEIVGYIRWLQREAGIGGQPVGRSGGR